MVAAPPPSRPFRLAALVDGNGNQVALSYDLRGCIANVRASDGIDYQSWRDPGRADH